MIVFKRILVFVFLLTVLSGFASAQGIDQLPGNYWYDYIGNVAVGGQPSTEVGEMVLTANSMSLSYLSSPDGDPGNFGFTYTNPVLDEAGYLTMQTNLGPMQVLVNGNYIGRISDGTGNEPLSHGLMLRKAENPTLADVAGDYTIFQHVMHGDPGDPPEEAEGIFGTATLSVGTPNAWSANISMLNSTGFYQNLPRSGTWTLDSAEGTIDMLQTGMSTVTCKIAANGIFTSTIIDGVNSNPARLVAVKQGTGHTVEDLVGTYTLQSFDSNTAGTEFWATWGTLEITPGTSSGVGNWVTTTSNSEGAVDAVSNGTFTVDDDGTLHILDWKDTPMSGAVNIDQDLLVISGMNPTAGEVGIMFAVRPLPIPE
ncbi:MAG: hypothetical protein PVH19_15580, partial [Planctomycetia bacterium]